MPKRNREEEHNEDNKHSDPKRQAIDLDEEDCGMIEVTVCPSTNCVKDEEEDKADQRQSPGAVRNSSQLPSDANRVKEEQKEDISDNNAWQSFKKKQSPDSEHVTERSRERQICSNFVKGRCELEERCGFSHDLDRAKKPVKRSRVCLDLLKGECKFGECCKFSHDLDAPPRSRSRSRRRGRVGDVDEWGRKRGRSRGGEACRDFRRGRCHFGEGCQYSHDESHPWDSRERRRGGGARDFGRGRSPPRSRARSLGGNAESRRVCLDFRDRGYCSYGRRCTFSHNLERFARRVCLDFKNGRCTYGDRCSFSHSIRLGGSSSSKRVCLDLREDGYCPKGDRCKFNHDLERFSKRVCLDFKNGNCTYGERCSFSHTYPAEDDDVHKGINSRRVCLDLRDEGHCSHGNDCQFSHDLDRFARRVCLDFKNGQCSYGERCSFSHDIDKLQESRGASPRPDATGARPSDSRGRDPNIRQCLDFRKGKCLYGKDCRYAHDMADRTLRRLCLDFKKGYCSYGDECAFSHNLEKMALRNSTISREENDETRVGSERKEACLDFEKGRCLYGDDCRYLHVLDADRSSRRSCLDYMKGRCRFGSQCSFSHNVEPRIDDARSERDLRRPPPCLDFAKGRCFYGSECKFYHRPEPRMRSRERRRAPNFY